MNHAVILQIYFHHLLNRGGFYRGKDCIKKFCKELKEICTRIVNYEQKEMTPLTDKEKRYYEEQKKCHICQKRFYYNKKEKKDL